MSDIDNQGATIFNIQNTVLLEQFVFFWLTLEME